MTKLFETISEGFDNFLYALNFYNQEEYYEYWEALSLGWIQMNDEYIMSQPNFDPYNLSGRDPYYSYSMRNK